MTPEIGELLDKARDCLARARIILAAGVGEDAGRDAYLAGFHAAQAVIRARTGRTAKTHRGVHRTLSQLARRHLNWCCVGARNCGREFPSCLRWSTRWIMRG